MNFLEVPEDVYTAETKQISRRLYNPNLQTSSFKTFVGKTASSEEFLKSIIDYIKAHFLDTTAYNIYNNQNYMTLDYYSPGNSPNVLIGLHIRAGTQCDDLTTNWMLPCSDEARATMNTFNLPVTRTISIIINSNTLPVYTINESISVSVELQGSIKEWLIPAGEHTYNTINQSFTDFIKTYGRNSAVLNYYGLNYFFTSRYPLSTGCFNIIDNEEFNKYYGLLHMFYTNPQGVIDTTVDNRKQPTNMPPVYRSLHIPEDKYLPNDFVNYINNNSEYHYTRNGVDGLSYTQFLSEIDSNNDIIIYTTDGTEFFINPICKMNTYQETNFSSSHRLCHCSEGIKWDNLNKRYFIGDTIDITGNIIGPFEGLSATGLPDGLIFATDTENNTCSITGTISKNNKVGEYTITISTTTIDDPLVFNIYVDARKYVIYYKN